MFCTFVFALVKFSLNVKFFKNMLTCFRVFLMWLNAVKGFLKYRKESCTRSFFLSFFLKIYQSVDVATNNVFAISPMYI